MSGNSGSRSVWGKVRSLFGKGSEDKVRPNVIMILLDQFRNDARDVHPVFEELKGRGVLFSRVMTYAPYTLASLHATYTGLYGRDTGVDGYTRSSEYDGRSCYTIAEYLRDAGYHTRGYTFSSILFPHEGFDALKIVPEQEETGILESHLREIDAAFSQDRPFFLYLHYGEIHHGILRDVLRRYDAFDQEYFGDIERNREHYRKYAHEAGIHVERLLEAIDTRDPGRETLLVVMTDHGGGVGERPGEKAYGVYTYNYTICVWMYLSCRGMLPERFESKAQVRTVDLLPTLMDLLGVAPSKKHKPLRGSSLMPIIRGEEFGDRLAFSETGGVEGPHPSPDAANVKTVSDGRWKLIYNTTTNHMELYDLAADPHETKNLRTIRPDKAQELWQKMAEFL